MFINKAEFVADVHEPGMFPEPLDGEVEFVGRSNVGKSSLLNSIFGHKIAKTSSTPGKTKSLIFFKVNALYHFIDFPGYGYAKTSKGERDRWLALIDSYFKAQRPRQGIFLLIDSRIPDQKSDLEAFDWLKKMDRVFLILTKIDKIKKIDLQKKIDEVKSEFKGYELILPVSVINKEGIKELENILEECFEKTR